MMKQDSAAQREFVLVIVLLATGVWTLGCGRGGAGSVAHSAPPPPSISVSVTPSSGAVLLGETLSFSATVSNSTNTSVTWSVNGAAGGTVQAGTISADGLYTAPIDLPTGGTVQVTATSQADTSKSANATVAVTSDVTVSVTPNVSSVELGAQQIFQATIQSQGRADSSVRWSLAGAECPTTCGTVNGSGVYTAPQILPNSTTVPLVATSVADPSKQSSASVTICSHFTLRLNAPGNMATSATTSLVATLTPVAGSNPNPTLSWSVSGSGCVGSACGLLSVTTTQSAGGTPLENTAVYTAPSTAPEPDTVLITVTPLADPSKEVQANITILAGASLSISPASGTVVANSRLTLDVTQSGASGSLNWTINGVAGGNTTFGQICTTGSNPCQPYSSGNSTQVDYLAPGSIPSPNPVAITVSNASNSSLSTSAQITIINHVVVSVLPGSVTLPPLGVQTFTASVLGTTNQSVVWQIEGSGCGIAGSCGTVDSSRDYTAPGTPPTPNAIQIVATSEYDTTQSGIGNVTVSTQLAIVTLHPASVYVGGQEGFTLQVDGSGFVASSPGPGSTLVIGGTARVTNCAGPGVCTAPVTSTDVAQVGNLSIQVQNPNGSMSNIVQLVRVQPTTVDNVITLGTGSPSATGMNITVVEPTTAGIDTEDDDLDLNIAALGLYTTSTNTCSLGGNAIPLIRPTSGIASVDICVFSESGLDTSMTYSVSGAGDVAVISQQPAGLGIIHLTLQLPATATPGARTLFIQNTNLDQTSASGVLQVQ
ncbi:MAG TPA: hypothetical protein VMH20_09335 [Verrucomicrobiae bacterium]|nr:hypothetical protein [Verrucomicrobiae bacterium]